MTERPRDLLARIVAELEVRLAEPEISPAAGKLSKVARRERGRALALRRWARVLTESRLSRKVAGVWSPLDLDDDAAVDDELRTHAGCEAGASLYDWYHLERLPVLAAKDENWAWRQLQAASRHPFTPTADGGWVCGLWTIPPEGEPTFGGSPV